MGPRSISSCFTASQRSRRCLLALGLSACATDNSPARIQFTQDTTIINTRLASDVAMRVLDKRGHDVEKARVGYVVAPDSLLWVMQNGKVGCLKNGVGTVTVSSGTISALTNVRCELIASLGPKWSFNVVRLIVGDPGVPIPADPRGEEGKPMERARFPITVSDSTVVQLKDGLLFGLTMGSSWIGLTAGGRADVGVWAEVYERIFNQKEVHIGAGDFFMHRLAQGEYQLDSTFERAGVRAAWTATPCAGASGTPDIHDTCIARAGAALVLRNTTSAPIDRHISLMWTTAKRMSVKKL